MYDITDFIWYIFAVHALHYFHFNIINKLYRFPFVCEINFIVTVYLYWVLSCVLNIFALNVLKNYVLLLLKKNFWLYCILLSTKLIDEVNIVMHVFLCLFLRAVYEVCRVWCSDFVMSHIFSSAYACLWYTVTVHSGILSNSKQTACCWNVGHCKGF